MRKIGLLSKITIMLIVTVLSLVGCVGPETSHSGNNSDGEVLKVALVTNSAGLGDRSFADSAWAGFQKAKQELGIEIKVMEPSSVVDYPMALTTMAEQGYKLVVGIGFDMKDAVATVAPKYPDTKFATVNVMVEEPNVAVARFKDHQGSFLAGALAGMMTETNVIGFVGGDDFVNIRRFLVGYEEGAKYVNPDVKVLSSFVGAFNDPGKGKEFTLDLISKNADIIFHAAAKSGEGVIDGAKQSGVYAIGVDQDQDYIAPGTVLTSMVKNIDVAMFDMIKAMKEGNFEAGVHEYGLLEDGVGLSEMQYTKDKVPAEARVKIEDLKQQIIDGEITVTDVFNEK